MNELNPPPAVGDRIEAVEVQGERGEPVRLAECWQSHPVALFFLRHLGCVFCREHVDLLRRDYERFRKAGGEVVVITMGAPTDVARFRQSRKLPFPCLADPHRAAYRALSVPVGTLGQVAGPAVWGAGFKAMLTAGAGIPKGDIYQLHGAFVIDGQGILRWAHRPQTSADYPDHEQMIAAIEQATT